MSECWVCQGRTLPDYDDLPGHWPPEPEYDCDCDFELPYEVNKMRGKEARERLERRELDRTKCGKGDCNLTPDHAGSHRGACGCDTGCAAVNCPNAPRFG